MTVPTMGFLGAGAVGNGLALGIGGRPLSMEPEDRALYHASAVLCCGYLIVLGKAAADLWQEMGIPRDEALSAIRPLGPRPGLTTCGGVGWRTASQAPWDAATRPR